ncbi:unnamed protein product [Chilo suppressalis]|uniref:Nuclear respiratory factor 1 NLS/DNA-binding dimerisation domain-containing protein n=1 Tax=Chilo suppressalis TaxID=168631 RepID=A0ABN8B945_CHISP|nr:unnamed protein product [Chilo suppressalis]
MRLCSLAANDRGVRDARGAAGGGAGGDSRQAQHLVPRVRRQAPGGRGPQSALHDHGGAGERARAAVRSVGWGIYWAIGSGLVSRGSGSMPGAGLAARLSNVGQFGLGGCDQAPPPPADDPSLFELPPLIIDGIPTPVEKMTQAQLRAFIPLMLKYSMVRGKPGWGRESTRPPWWPKDLPWANVRMDARSEDEKQKMSWTHALRQIVINCYKYHGREDLLPAFTEDDEKGPPTQPMSQYAPAVLQTITNPDGTVSLIQVDPNNPIITLPDGTTAQVIHSGEGGGGTGVGVVQALDGDGTVVDLNAVAEATLNHDGQLILTGEDGHGYPVSVSGVITVPVSASVYQSMVASMQHHDGVCVAPIVQVEQGGETLEALSMGGGVAQVMLQGAGDQVLQVLSLKDASVLSKAMQQVKAERDAVVADS